MRQAAFKRDLFEEIEELRLERDQARADRLVLTILSVLLGFCVLYSVFYGW